MKKMTIFLLAALITFFLVDCSSKPKLKQENAETAIRNYFTDTAPKQYMGDVNFTGRLNTFPARLTKIEPIIQLTDTEASCIFYIEYASPNECKATFKMNVDGEWLLTSITGTRISSHVPAIFFSWLGREPNIKVQ